MKINSDTKPPRPQTAKHLYELKIKSNSILKEQLRHYKPPKINEKVINFRNSKSESNIKSNNYTNNLLASSISIAHQVHNSQMIRPVTSHPKISNLKIAKNSNILRNRSAGRSKCKLIFYSALSML